MNQQDHDNRSREIHRIVVNKIRDNPLLWDDAAIRLQRWILNSSPRNSKAFEEWQIIMNKGMESCFEFMMEDSQKADQLRQSSPFSCALSPKERLEIFRQWKKFHEKK